MTIFLAPPGETIGTFSKGTSKEMFVAKVSAAGSDVSGRQLRFGRLRSQE